MQVYHCQALVVAPGGFGTMDELFEVLTLKQTGKIQKTLPVVLFGKDFWQTAINWQVITDMFN
jgi:predicted Rossmann-fold nucleotide-binding protein